MRRVKKLKRRKILKKQKSNESNKFKAMVDLMPVLPYLQDYHDNNLSSKMSDGLKKEFKEQVNKYLYKKKKECNVTDYSSKSTFYQD